MRITKVIEGRSCPSCGSMEGQKNKGFTISGTQRCMCKVCGKWYSMNPKSRAYSEELRMLAIKEHLSGLSGRRIGAIHGMSKANVYNWIKKNGEGVDKLKN